MLLSEQCCWLVMRLQKGEGDRRAFDVLYYEYHSLVFRNIIRYVHRQEIAEDILQEVFLALWEHRLTLDPSKPVDNWLFVVSYNKSVNWLKKNVREKAMIVEFDSKPYDIGLLQSEEDCLGEQVTLLQQAVERLPLRKRQAFSLCKIEGRSYDEASEVLGVSVETVKEYVKTSSQLIRKYIASKPATHVVCTVGIMLYLSL